MGAVSVLLQGWLVLDGLLRGRPWHSNHMEVGVNKLAQPHGSQVLGPVMTGHI